MSPTVPPISVMTTSTSSSASLAKGAFDFVGDVGDDLHRLAQVFAASFFFDHGKIDLPGREVAHAAQRGVGEALVMAQIQVRFGAVVENVHFAVLIRAHRARVDIDVRIEFLQADAQAASFEQHSHGCAGQALAQGADHASGHEDVLGHKGIFLAARS